MKPVVPALDAQSGVGAGGKRFGACILRAIPNGMRNPSLFVRRPEFVEGKAQVFRVRLGIEPAMR